MKNHHEEEEEEFTVEDQLEMEAAGVLMKPGRNERPYINKAEILLQKAEELQLANIAETRLPWIETLDIASPKPLELQDVHNDLARELAFYQQALHAAKEAKIRVKQAGIAFERPDDYYAEMVKSDDHMTRVREKMLEEAEGIKKSEEAKKMRDMKKFGKKVQVQKLQERQKAKSDTLDKINELKRKRKNNPGTGLDDDEFDIALEDKPSKKGRNDGPNKNAKRVKKDEKYGFGGKKKYAKSNTSESTDDYKFNAFKNRKLPSGFKGAKKDGKKTQKTQKQRPGKGRRQSMRNK